MTEVDARGLIVLGVVLFVATYAKYVLKYSAKEYFKLFLGEFKDLLEREMKPNSINAFGVVIASLVLVTSLLMPQFSKLITMSQDLPSSGEATTSAYAAATFILLASFLCVNLIRPKS